MRRLRDWLSLVRFSHSVFALPFALSGAWLAADGVPSARTLCLIVLCAVAARTAAMGFNRLADRAIDAANPRTRAREIPSGRIAASAVRVLVLVSAAAFVAFAFLLNPLAGWLSFPVLGVLLGYSYVKRFSASAHLVLGLALAIAPLGAWIAVRGAHVMESGELGAGFAAVLWLALAVLLWVAGFDLIYACQDAEFDRANGLHSIPARFGLRGALALSSLLHVLAVLALALAGVTAELGAPWWIALALCAALLVWQHRIVAPDDLSRVNLAFFTLNGWVSIALFVGLALDRALAPGVA